MIFWKCWFFHKWTKWSDAVAITEHQLGGSCIAQFKVCERCNIKKWKRILITN